MRAFHSYNPVDRPPTMTFKTEQKLEQPEMARQEKVEVVSRVNGVPHNNIQAFESRSIDLRTILGLLVLLRAA
jgi:hypothetical protein